MKNKLRILLLRVVLIWLFLACGTAAAGDVPLVSFNVKGFVVEGENPLAEEKTQKILRPFLGEHEGLKSIKAASEALEQVLQDKGYAFHRVVIPPQRIPEGVIRLQVISFKLDKVEVEGNTHFSDENILASLLSLRPGQSPNTFQVARSLLIANEHPSKRLAVFLRNSETPRKIDAKVKARDIRPYHFFTSFSNTGTSETGRTRLSLGFQHSNLFGRDNVVTLSYTTSPGHWSDMQQYGFNYRRWIYSLGARLNMFYAYSRVDQGTVADFFKVSGEGYFSGVSIDYALLPFREYSHQLSIGLQDRLFENDTTFLEVPLPTAVDVRSTPLSFRYTGRWEKAKRNLSFHVQYARNFAWGEHNDTQAYTANRAGADHHWEAVSFGSELNVALPRQWRVRAGLTGQFTDEPLIPGEQFGLGGARSIRGFEEREVLGDSGQQFSIEFWTPIIAYNLQVLGFFDAGHLRLKDPHPGLPGSETLVSLGLGLRWRWKDKISLSLDAALVTQGTDNTNSGDGRLHFNAFLRF